MIFGKLNQQCGVVDNVSWHKKVLELGKAHIKKCVFLVVEPLEEGFITHQTTKQKKLFFYDLNKNDQNLMKQQEKWI